MPPAVPITPRRGRPAFSLVELVIVIVILTIIAMIAIPRIGVGAAAAEESALKADLTRLRKAIDLYAAEHRGVYPGATDAGGSFGVAGSEAAFVNQLTLFTDIQGRCSETRDGEYMYGPYLSPGIPPLPLGPNRGSRRVSTSNSGPFSAVVDGTGWVYNFTTGRIIANADDMDRSGSTPYDEY